MNLGAPEPALTLSKGLDFETGFSSRERLLPKCWLLASHFDGYAKFQSIHHQTEDRPAALVPSPEPTRIQPQSFFSRFAVYCAEKGTLES
jgi:hypothetical protein